MKKSTQILGLPIISITEGRELGMSKSLLIDAKNGAVAAITIDDEDWYRGVKLLPFDSVIAVGEDAVTITNSENILQLEDAIDFENLLDENIRIIGTKAITKSGTIQGEVTEIYVGEDGKVMQVSVTAPDGTVTEVSTDQISIFGKQVTVIDDPNAARVAPPAAVSDPAVEMPMEPAVEAAPAAEIPVEEPAVEMPVEEAPVEEAPVAEPTIEPETPAEEAPVEEAPAVEEASPAEDRHRRFLLGKKASRKISTDTGVVIVEEGGSITEEVLQKAKLANKIIELSMNVQ
ncbi:hypothetical protein TAMA11512_03390 [Selenomonas sp. TAMA-11512]|uniref:PRC-barrel domain-containing protein n=1 Tax=Selenomonas sp. TAMA-11512 TaxID=3095337 RepID=UPI00308D40F5|nr:hypothetical protein TAMA11512_03390 [Selenomonas sp. TAMA-11512]